MITKITQGDIKHITADAMVVAMFEGEKKPSGVIADVDKALNGAITQIISSGEFKAKIKMNKPDFITINFKHIFIAAYS